GRFREFLARHASHKEAPSARYGLALCLIQGPTREYPQAAEQLQPLVNDKTFPDRVYALYYLGLAQRGQGVKALAQAALKPAEAAAHRNTARTRFEEAVKQFAAAVKAFEEKAEDAKAPRGVPIEREWAARARCDQAEMLLRLRKAKEARTTAAPFLTDKALR